MTPILNSPSASDLAAAPLNKVNTVANVSIDIGDVNMFTKFIKSIDEGARGAL